MHVGSDGSVGKNNTNWDHRNEASWKGIVCGKCCAVRTDQQLGNERVLDCGQLLPAGDGLFRRGNCAELDWASGCYTCRMVLVCRELRRVLRDDGVMWWNHGYSWNGGNMDAQPWKLALAIQQDGWLLCQTMPWVKRSTMPESIKNRPAKALEEVFMFAKRPGYFYDAEAVRRVATTANPGDDSYRANGKSGSQTKDSPTRGSGIDSREGQTSRNFWNADLWFDSVDKPHGLCGVGDELVGLDVTSGGGFKGAHFACVDADTECLTTDGWKRQEDLTDGEWIAAYDMKAEVLRWEQATFHRYNYDGEMVRFDKPSTSQMLTPNHRCLVLRPKGKGRQWGMHPEVVIARKLGYMMKMPVSAKFYEPNEEGIGVEWAALVGWMITEGSIVRAISGNRRFDRVNIYQSLSANPNKVEEIRMLLKTVAADFKERKYESDWRGRPSVMITFVVMGDAARRLIDLAPDKEMHAGLARLPFDEATALLNAMINGDGHCRKDDKRVCIIQKSKRCMDFMQMLVMRLGRHAVIGGHNVDCLRLSITTKRWVTTRGTGGSQDQLGMVQYKGTVWCPNVPSSFWLARRDGKPFITGNTFPKGLVEPLLKAGTSQYGACMKCGAPWRRVTETTQLKRDRPNEHVKRTGEEGTGNSCGNTVAGVSTRTVGWRPDCICCQECSRVGVSSEIRRRCRDAFQRSRTCKRVRQTEGQETLGGPELQGQDQTPETEVQDNLQAVQEGDDGEERRAVLHQNVCHEVAVGQRIGEQVCPSEAEQVRQRPEERQDRKTSQVVDGATSRQKTGKMGRGSSHKREQGRQPVVQPSSGGEGKTQEDAHEQAAGHRLVPYPVRPCIVLDPFCGSGTTLVVAIEHGRWAWGIDLSRAYLERFAIPQVKAALWAKGLGDLAGPSDDEPPPRRLRLVKH